MNTACLYRIKLKQRSNNVLFALNFVQNKSYVLHASVKQYSVIMHIIIQLAFNMVMDVI